MNKMELATSSMFVLGLTIFIFTYILLYCLKKLCFHDGSVKFPGPPHLPLMGGAHYFIRNPEGILKKIQDFAAIYPSPFQISLVGLRFYFVYNPEQIKTIFLSPKTSEKADAYKIMEPCLGDALLTAPDAKWKINRKLIQPTFNTRILESFVDIFSAQSRKMIRQMEPELNKGQFDIHDYVSLCTLDFICETAMGVQSKTQAQGKSSFVESVEKFSEIITSRLFKVWLHPNIIFNNTKIGHNFHKVIECIDDFTNDVIKRKKLAQLSKENVESTSRSSTPSEAKRKVFLDLLMDVSLEGTKFTDEELLKIVNLIIFAGYDLTSKVNSFTILMLANHPEIQEKVYKELFQIYGNEDPHAIPVKAEDLHRMEYLERVIKETLRLFPAAPIIGRRLTDDLSIGEFTLKKGGTVVLNIIKTHRSKEFWKDPMIFDPDRFLPEECAKRHPYAYIPFSAGPRNCLGFKYAMMSMKVLIATFIRMYKVENDNIVPIEDIKFEDALFLKPVEPIKVRIEQRIFKYDGKK